MPRKANRITIAKGIYRDGIDGPYEVRATVGGTAYSARLPKDATLEELKRRRAQLEVQGRTTTPRAEHGTLRKDAARYIGLIKHLSTWDDREDHLASWCALYGDRPRYRITESDVLAARVQWLKDGTAPKTINHRCDTLRNLYHRLDGRRAPTPCDDVRHLAVPKTVIERVPDALILSVDQQLQQRERDPICRFDGAKTRARFRVFVSTGKRPCEIMRAQPQDVNLEARVWVPRDAKGGYCPGVYLNDDQLEAWKLFIAADAWGRFYHGSFARTIRHAGWPPTIRPYQARHTMWITAVERGTPLDVVADGAGHKGDGRLTKQFYTGVVNGPLQAMSQRMDGRFAGWPVVPERGPAKDATPATRKRQG